MIEVPLNSITVGVIFTLVNAFVEFAFLTAMLTTLALHECKKLKKGKLINIRNHCRYVKVITLSAIMLFISLEIIYSRIVDDESRFVKGYEPCVRTQINIPFERPSSILSKENSLINFHCLKAESDTFHVRLGKYSNETGKVECAAKEVFSYKENWITDFPINSGVVGCAGEPLKDRGMACITARAEGRIVYFSEPYLEVDFNKTTFTRNISFFKTKVSFNPRRYLKDFAEGIAWLGRQSVTDFLHLRRAVFLRDVSTTCEMKQREKKVTMIPSIFLAIMITLWTFSLMLFGLTCIWKREVFYDIRNTWDCATKTSYRFNDQEKGEFYLKCIEANGEKRIYVTDSGDEDRLSFEEYCNESTED